MRKLTIPCLIVVSILLLATSYVSIVGTKPDGAVEVKTAQSPLFRHRIEQSTNHLSHKLLTTYLGKGKTMDFGFSSKSAVDEIVDEAVILIRNNPRLINKIVDRLKSMLMTQLMLKKYGLTNVDLERYIAQIQNDPLLLQKEMEQAKAQLRGGKTSGEPMGLNTSNPFGCVITIIALLPVMVALLVVFLIIATITIITCLNINNCLTNLTDQISKIITQELLPP